MCKIILLASIASYLLHQPIEARPKRSSATTRDLISRLQSTSLGSSDQNSTFQDFDPLSERVIISTEEQVQNETFSVDGTETFDTFANGLRDWRSNISSTVQRRSDGSDDLVQPPETSHSLAKVLADRPWEWIADENFFRRYAAQAAGNCYHVRVGGVDLQRNGAPIMTPAVTPSSTPRPVEAEDRFAFLGVGNIRNPFNIPIPSTSNSDSVATPAPTRRPNFVELRPDLMKVFCFNPGVVPSLPPEIVRVIENKTGTRAFNVFYHVSPALLPTLALAMEVRVEQTTSFWSLSSRRRDFLKAVEIFRKVYHLEPLHVGEPLIAERTQGWVPLPPEASRLRSIINDPSNGDGLIHELGYNREQMFDYTASDPSLSDLRMPTNRNLLESLLEYMNKTRSQHMAVLVEIAKYLNENQNQILRDSKALQYKEFSLGHLLLDAGQWHYDFSVGRLQDMVENTPNPRPDSEVAVDVQTEPLLDEPDLPPTPREYLFLHED